MRALPVAVGWIVASGLVVGCAKEKVAPPPPPTVVASTTEDKDRVERTEVTTVTATVVKVDQKTRDVTLKGPEGRVETIRVGAEVRNLPQVHKGDRVVVKYYEAVAFQMNRKGKKELDYGEAEVAERAAVGEQPGAAAGRVVKVRAAVTDVDRTKSTVSLKGPRGRTVVVNVKEPRYLEKVKKGETVDITYTEALAIAVEPAP